MNDTDERQTSTESASPSQRPVVIAPEVLDVVRFLAKTWAAVDAFVYQYCDGEALMHYPVVQGTANQIALKRIGEQNYDAARIHAGVEWLLASNKEVESQEPSRITEQDAREILSAFEGWDKSQFMQGTYDGWLKAEGRALLNRLNADREQVSDDAPAQKVWDYYQALLKHYGFDGITDLLVKYRKLVDQAPAVAVSEDHEAIDTASLRKGFGTARGRVEQVAAYHAALNSCCDEIDRLRSKVAAAPSHSHQSAEGTTSTASREEEMVVIELDSAGVPTIWCDPEIVDLVTALNKSGIRTVASCSGHGYRPGNIALADGRELVIARTFEEAREIDRLFLTDINGDHYPSHDSEQGE